MGGRKPLIPVIVGPTAVGKTAVAVALGRLWPITVISADSRQIYKWLDVGTAKPSPADLEAVPHLGIDLIEPGERYSAGQFAREAARWLTEIPVERRAVVVGGTGFYVRALADGLFFEPPMDPARRIRIRKWATSSGHLGRWAARLDPRYTGGGRQRAARVVEIALLTGRSLSWWQRQARVDGVMRPWFVRLTVPRALLHARIADRVRYMLDAGLVSETRRLLERGLASDAPGLDAVGYAEVAAHLGGRLGTDRLADAIAASTRRYAKRQETWFRHQLLGYPVVNLDATAAPGVLARRIVDLWEARGD